MRAGALEIRPVQKRLVIYRGARKFEFWDGARLVRTGKVAVGAPGAETPLGLFYVTDKFNPAIDPDWAILGAFAFETSAYSKLTDWPGGGIVGVHGTPWPNLLGQAVSHGCIRLAQPTTSSSSATASRSGRRSRSSAERKRRADVERSAVSVT